VNAAAKEIRKNYSKKISEKLITLIRSSLRVLARYFNSAAVGEAQALETKSKGEEGYDAGQCSGSGARFFWGRFVFAKDAPDTDFAGAGRIFYSTLKSLRYRY
jgi:hypothetical protein